MLKIKTTLLLIGIAITLSSCGFKLKGSFEIPYQAIYLQAEVGSRVGKIIKKKIQRTSYVNVVQTMSDAEVAIIILSEVSIRTVAVLSNAGSVDEYELVYTIGYRIDSTNNSINNAERQLVLRRKITHSDLDIAAKSNEENSLINDMASEAATRILVRLSRKKNIGL
ncbi:LPS assembly lipoprotein LptE [Burkholderiales bacterium]|nr:LPS assembly lipoprotein LptE [Burkholderiales bacterium]